MDATTHRVIPKFSSSSLVAKAGYLAVEEGSVYNYYPLNIGNVQGNFAEIDKLPPVLMPGYVTVNGQVYQVTLKDLQRRRINVGSAPITVVEPTSSRNSSKPRTQRVLAQTSTNPNQSGTDAVSEFQINEDVDLAWKNQIESILYIEDPEAEWEFLEDTAQPQSNNESGPVQDIVEAA